MEFTRNLVEREIGLQEFLELADVDGRTLVQAVEAGAGLTAEFIVDADDSSFADAGELIDEFFDFTRVDIFAHADNHVLEAVDDIDVTLFVGTGDVTRMEPAAAQGIFVASGRFQ